MEQLPLEVTLIFESKNLKNLKSNLTIDLLSMGNNPKTIINYFGSKVLTAKIRTWY